MFLSVLLTVATATSAESNWMAAVELRPAPRIGATLEHRLSDALRLSEALTFGLGSFPDLELRVALHPEVIAPFAPWVAFRLRRIDLSGLPPVENYALFGVSASTGAARRFSATAGFGVRLQVPPLAPEPAGDPGAYFAENVAAEVHFSVRVRLW